MVTLLSVVTTIILATRHCNQSASRILWKLPLQSNLPLMGSFTWLSRSSYGVYVPFFFAKTTAVRGRFTQTGAHWGLSFRGGAKAYVTSRTSRAGSPKSLTTGVQEPVSSRAFHALLSYLSLIFIIHSDTFDLPLAKV